MPNPSNRSTGYAILVPAILGMLAYSYFVWFTQYSDEIIKYTVFAVVIAILGLVASIGITMAIDKKPGTKETK